MYIHVYLCILVYTHVYLCILVYTYVCIYSGVYTLRVYLYTGIHVRYQGMKVSSDEVPKSRHLWNVMVGRLQGLCYFKCLLKS